MVKQSFDLNVPKDSSNTDEAAQNGGTPKSVTFEIHHGGCFTPTPSRSYIGGQVSTLMLVDNDEFCLHDLTEDMVVKLGYGVADLMYFYFLRPRLGLDYDTRIFVTHKKGVAIAVDNHLRKGLIEIDSSPDVNRNLTPMCHRNLTKEWEHVSSKTLSIDLDEILGDYINTRNQITGDDITGKQMVVHVGNSSTVDDVLDLQILFETKEVGPIGKFKEDEVEVDNESEDESDIEENYTSGSDSEDLDYDPKHDEVFEDVHVSMNNFNFNADPRHDLCIVVVEVQEHDIDVIDYDSFDSDLDDGIDSERRIQLRELRRIGKQKNNGPNKYYFYLGQQFASKEIMKGRVKKYSVETRRQLILMGNHVIKSLATNPNIPVRAVQDQIQKQFELLREYAQELINQNPGTTVRIDVQQEPNPESLTRTFRRVYVCLGALKQGFRAYGRQILGLDGCFMSGPWPGQILTAVGIDANNEIYPVAYAIVEAESKASWCWFLNLLGEDLGIEANFNYTFISDRQKGLIQAIASVFPSAEHRYCVRHIHENMKSQFKGGVYKEMLWNAAKATSEGEFKKKMGELKSFNSDAYDWLMKIPLEQWSRAHFSGRAKCDLLINNICEVFNRQLVDGRDQPIITCLEYIREYLMKRIVVVQKVIAKTIGPLTPSVTKMKWELTGIPCKHDVVVIYNMSENSVGVVVESKTVIIPPLYKTLIGRPPKKRKKSNDEITSQSASSGKLSRKGKSVSYGKCGNVGHNRKGCRGQGGGSSQAGARKVSSQAVGSRKVSGQAAGARNVSGQAAGARNASGQAVGAS
ncbi:mutator type transposase [Tanacetum coccineum]